MRRVKLLSVVKRAHAFVGVLRKRRPSRKPEDERGCGDDSERRDGKHGADEAKSIRARRRPCKAPWPFHVAIHAQYFGDMSGGGATRHALYTVGKYEVAG